MRIAALRIVCTFVLAVALWALTGIVLDNSASAGAYRVLHNFCSKPNCKDGANPSSGLAIDGAGNLYGTTYDSGAHSGGVVFELSPTGEKNKWQYTVLYAFCRKSGCPDGASPDAALIVDTVGNLYGTTHAFGKERGGTAFELSPNIDHTSWDYRVLHFFGGNGTNDGFTPNGLTYAGAQTGALYDGVSPLYGTTFAGGTEGFGSVFEMKLNDKKTRWTEAVIYSFCSLPNCVDGYSPASNLFVQGSTGLFGTTTVGGTEYNGVVFKLSRDKNNLWSQTILYNFCALADCADGSYPIGTLVMDPAGNLLGTTTYGGSTPCDTGEGCGVLFKVSSAGVETVFYDFCSAQNCTDGEQPMAGLITDASGNLYGTTTYGGAVGAGTVFEFSGTYSVLHSFETGCCKDGGYPYAPLIMDGSGNLFGTGRYAGKNDGGIVFQLKP